MQIALTKSQSEIFNFDGSEVRTIIREGEPWFVAADVCRVLELCNTSKACEALDDDERGITNGDTLGGTQQILIISESGLYSLVHRSRKPEARRFQRWINREVIPSIRKTGSYSVNQTSDAMTPMVLNALGQLIETITTSHKMMCSHISEFKDATANALHDHSSKLQRLDYRLDSIENSMRGFDKRKPFGQNSINLFKACIQRFYGGRCPITHELIIDDDGHIDTRLAHIEHWHGKNDNAITSGWIVSAKANEALKDECYRASVKSAFDEFHRSLRMLQPDAMQTEFKFTLA